MMRIFILAIISLLIISSCSKLDTDINYESCDDISDIENYLQELIDKRDYITRYEENTKRLSIYFNNAESISIPLECISSYNIINDDNFVLEFSENTLLKIPYLSFRMTQMVYNPSGHTPLSAKLTIMTDLPGSGIISINNKMTGEKEILKEYTDMTTDHSYPILGLYYDHLNIVTLDYYVDGQLAFSEDYEIQTPAQPDYFPEIVIAHIEKERMEPGMNFISYLSKENPNIPFMVDTDGEIRYVLDFSADQELNRLNYDVGMERLQNGNFYFGAWTTENLYEVDVLGYIVNKWTIPGYKFHHNIQEKEDGNFLLTADKLGSTHLNGNSTKEDYILEIDRTSGMIINEWDLKESLDEYRDVQSVNLSAATIDWAHANAVIHDPSDNTIIVSCRKQGIVKLTQDNEVVWLLNNHFSYGSNRRGQDMQDYLLTPLDGNGVMIDDSLVLNGLKNHLDFEWNWFQHAPFLMDDGTLFCFDNGDKRNYNFRDVYSRAVGYKIDASNMTVQQVWDYGKEGGVNTFSRIVSDVDYHPQKDNILFAPGARVDHESGTGGAIVEIDYSTKEVVFEMHCTAPNIVWHRVERMTLYP